MPSFGQCLGWKYFVKRNAQNPNRKVHNFRNTATFPHQNVAANKARSTRRRQIQTLESRRITIQIPGPRPRTPRPDLRLRYSAGQNASSGLRQKRKDQIRPPTSTIPHLSAATRRNAHALEKQEPLLLELRQGRSGSGAHSMAQEQRQKRYRARTCPDQPPI